MSKCPSYYVLLDEKNKRYMKEHREEIEQRATVLGIKPSRDPWATLTAVLDAEFERKEGQRLRAEAKSMGIPTTYWFFGTRQRQAINLAMDVQRERSRRNMARELGIKCD